MSILEGGDTDNLQDSIAKLSTRILEEQGNRREERFIWIVVIFILGGIIVFKDAENAATPVVTALFELIVLAILARRLGIGKTAALIDKVITVVAGEAKPKDG